ncbi:heme exporter protein CcmD [Roseospira goensis]|uniref:Heme exporter protein D n=1 Tax=Roseospira goensis TaxID=391922 RepID=A0A7W6RZW7_9PROT|nr:heme exporter protein CcmD [Roseospira goensis]
MTYLNMDGYAAFVWPSYGIAGVVMVALFVAVRAGLRRDERTLDQLRAATGGRRRAAGAAHRAGPDQGTGDSGAAAAAPPRTTTDPGGPERERHGDALDDATYPSDGGRA